MAVVGNPVAANESRQQLPTPGCGGLRIAKHASLCHCRQKFQSSERVMTKTQRAVGAVCDDVIGNTLEPGWTGAEAMSRLSDQATSISAERSMRAKTFLRRRIEVMSAADRARLKAKPWTS